LVDIIITYETLFDILRKEKSRGELQELAEDFYLQSFAFLKNKMDETTGDYFEKTQIQLRNAKKILKELFERRERKIINLAIDNARSNNMLVNKESMTPKEKKFFDDALSFVKLNKMNIIGPVLTGVMPSDLPSYNNPKEKKEKEEKERKAERKQEEKEKNSEVKINERKKEKKEQDSTNPKLFGELKVKIISSLPKFLGPNGEILGPFNKGEETTLPEKIVRILEKKGKAEVI